MAEDDLLVREGVKGLLETHPEIDLVAICEDLDSLNDAVAKNKPDAVLTDIRMPPTNTNEGIRFAEEIREKNPDLGVLVLSQYDEPEYAIKLLEGGSEGRGYLLKERVSDLEQIASALKQVAAGGSVIDPKVVENLVTARTKAEESPVSTLTPREREVLSEMAQGKNNAGIAEALVLTERAIEKHINSIFSKLGLSEEPAIHRRVKAVLLYLSAEPTQG